VLTADCVSGLDRGWEGREWGNCVLTADCVSRLHTGWEGMGVGELCVDSRLC